MGVEPQYALRVSYGAYSPPGMMVGGKEERGKKKGIR